VCEIARLRLFNQEVQRSLAELDRFRQKVDDIRDQRPRPLLIAAVPTVALSLLPLAIADYIKTFAEARVSMEAHSSATIIDMVIDQRCDIGIPSLAVSHVAGHSDHLFTA
jgi:DNA-binding transcriptional LysR family regulator